MKADGSEDMQSSLNLKVKHRESFRPFAPSVLREDVAEWFDLDGDSPYMKSRGVDVDYKSGDKLRQELGREQKEWTDVLKRLGMIKK